MQLGKTKTLPFDKSFIDDLIKTYPTPFHLYDGKGILDTNKRLHDAFAWVAEASKGKKAFRNHYAVKALPNPHILKLLADNGSGFDCSSVAELELCHRVGVRGERIFFTSNNTKAEEYKRALDLGAIVNLDDISHLDYLKNQVGLPDLLAFRYNPGPLREGNVLIGKPEEAKYGLTRQQIIEAYRTAQSWGVKRFGLHTMVASNELNADYFVETARMLFELALEIQKSTGIVVEFVNLGGGIGIPYRPDQNEVDIEYVASEIHNLHQKLLSSTNLKHLGLVSENGRYLTGPHGFLVSRAIHHKDIYKQYVGLDSCMANLMRPGMYGAYHHLTVLGKEDQAADHVYDVTGSLCENNDKFAIDRALPKIDDGDLIVIHDTGAHGHSMGFNYNGKLRSAELLIKVDGNVKLIRRAETLEDHFSTLDFANL